MPSGIFKRTREHSKKISEAHKKSGIEPPHLTGKDGSNWKGDNVCNKALHHWVKKHKGKSKKCEHCGVDGFYKEYIRYKKIVKMWSIHWANIDHKYRRNLDDWIGLCAKCHRRYDIENNGYKVFSGK